MKIATWNVNSINVRIPHLVEWARSAEPDVICLQETKCVDENFPLTVINELGYEAAFFGQKSYNGVAILSKFPIDDVEKGFPDDDDEAPKRLIAATIGGVRVVNTYIPNGTELGTDKFQFKLDWLQRLRRYFEESCSKDADVLLCGDFNVAMDEIDVWSVAQWEGKLHFTKTERAAMHYVKQWGFNDLFRSLHPDSREFSWWNYREGAWQRDQGLRIDYIWTSASLAKRARSCEIDRYPRGLEKPSDHAPVIAEFA
ncbi:MAG: exodeoxyribonuclease III [Acidobacteria bacterium]|nr:exodeoxyribonuclease III [Acidobacteriota bacterium]MCW5950090.1 exodeoxyribonuclease III [Pyrinomonadaceae bacterium]